MTPAMKIKRYTLTFLKYFSVIFAAFIALLPIASCVITAFKSPEEYANTNVMQMPSNWLYFDNFINAWSKGYMGLGFRTSLIILVFVLGGSLLFSSMLAYILNRFKFPGNGLIKNLFLFASLLPGIPCRFRFTRLCIIWD